jgi:transcriptional regulator with XRE-family HTH domain
MNSFAAPNPNDMTTQDQIRKNLATLRSRRGLSQEEVAAYLKISRPLISYYESGERDIPLPHLEKLSDLYGVEVADLMSSESDLLQADFAFAFRTNSLSESDLQSIAEFQKIVKNYLKLKSINDGKKSN